MRKFFLLLTVFLIATETYGQTKFQRRIGSSYYDFATRVIQTQDGNFLTVGFTEGFGSGGNAFIMKVNSSGNLMWIKDYSGINGDVITDVLELPDKKLVMCGYTNSYGAGSSDAFVMKTDSVGNIFWAKAYGDIFGEGFEKIVQDGANGFYISGWADIISGSQWGTTITRIDGSGSVLWSKSLDDALITREAQMTAISSGGVLLGNRISPNTSFSLWKFSSSGTLLWSNNYTPTPIGSGLFGLDVMETATGDIQVTTSLANVNTVAQAVDIFIIKFNSSGSLISDKSYGGTYIDNTATIAKTSDGGTIMCGYTNSAGNGSDDVYLIKLNPLGSVQWAKAYGTIWNEEPHKVFQTADNGFVFDGFTYSTGSAYDSTKVYLVKTDSLGNTLCNDISWTPTVNNQTLSISSATPPSNMTYPQEKTITWNLNIRNFYNVDICNQVSVEEISNPLTNWTIYPNPFSEQTTLKTNVFFHDAIFTVNNYLGQTVKELKNISGQTVTFSRDNLPSGLYFIQLTQDNQVITTTKIIIAD